MGICTFIVLCLILKLFDTWGFFSQHDGGKIGKVCLIISWQMWHFLSARRLERSRNVAHAAKAKCPHWNDFHSCGISVHIGHLIWFRWFWTGWTSLAGCWVGVSAWSPWTTSSFSDTSDSESVSASYLCLELVFMFAMTDKKCWGVIDGFGPWDIGPKCVESGFLDFVASHPDYGASFHGCQMAIAKFLDCIYSFGP